MKRNILSFVVSAVLVLGVALLCPQNGWAEMGGGFDKIDSEPILKTINLTVNSKQVIVNMVPFRKALEVAKIGEKVTIKLLNSKYKPLDLGTFTPEPTKYGPKFASIPKQKICFPGEPWLPGLDWYTKGQKHTIPGTLVIMNSKNKVMVKRPVSLVAIHTEPIPVK